MRLRSLAALLIWTGTTHAQNPVTPPQPPAANAPGSPEPGSPGTTPAVAATVNGQAITVAELDDALDASLPKAPITAGQRRQLRSALLDDLIEDVLVKQFLAKNGPKVDPAEIEAQMTALKARLVKENYTLADYLKKTGLTESKLRAEWAALIQLSGYVKQHVTDEQLKAYYAANKDHFDKVQVRVSHIVIRVGRDAPATERAAAREKLQAIRADVVAGKTDFAAAARRFSQCPSALQGGDLGFILRRGLPEDEPLAKAAFALKVGGVSEVVETVHGYHILAATDRKPGTPSTLEKCVVEVLEAYADDFRVELAARLRKEAKIQITLP